MEIGTRVSIVLRTVGGPSGRRRVTGYTVGCARVMRTGKQNYQRIRVRLEGGTGRATAWIHPDEEGIEWARGWKSDAARALKAYVALS